MSEPRFRPNQFREAASIDAVHELRDGEWRTFEPRAPVEWVLRGHTWKLRPGLTFSPYANPTRCNAHCSFCSEELLRHDADRLSARTTIGDHDRYFDGLSRAWDELCGFPMGLSLSGLEATSSPPWMLRLLELVEKHDPLFPHRVLYTNGSGLSTHPPLIDALARAHFDRVELSRCHFDEAINQRTMRFNRSQPIWRLCAFEETVRRVQAQVPVRLSCILNREGVSTLADVEEYLAHARDLGVQSVVFRELSALGDVYRENAETRWISLNRVGVRRLMEQIQTDDGVMRGGWTFVGVTSGYYYRNEVYQRDGVEVTLEASSYVAHEAAVRSRILQKLVFHSTGELCGDWVPNALVIGSYVA